MRIAVVGTGYVGLVTGACFAELGADVHCADIDADRVRRLASGRIPIYEPGLEPLVAANVKAGRLRFSTDVAAAVKSAGVAFIAVGTPSLPGQGHPDLAFVEAAATDIALAAADYTVLVTKSTVPVGTGRRLAQHVARLRPGAEIDVVSNPEFLREGSALQDFMAPDRVVIGVESTRAGERMRELYAPLAATGTPIVVTSREAAELTKYVANSYLAARITFINEVADLCERLGVDVQEVGHAVGLDQRIGAKFLQPGPGFGGSCFPKDTRALAAEARRGGMKLELVEAVIALNERRKVQMASRIVEACGGTVAGKSIAILGVTFKPDTDDMREAPSLRIVPALVRAGATVRAYDPQGMDMAATLLEDVVWCRGAYEAAAGADAVVVLTEWREFRALDMARLRRIMRRPCMIDLRNLYTPDEMAKAGFAYTGIGRPGAVAEREPARTGEPAFDPGLAAAALA